MDQQFDHDDGRQFPRQAVPRLVAIRNGGLFSSANGVFDMIPNNRAGSETYSRKKFIHAKPASGSPLALPPAANEDQAEIRPGEIENVDHEDASFHRYWPSRKQGRTAHCKRLIRPFASSIGHNHGLFDEI
jgi:hypothetical protein